MNYPSLSKKSSMPEDATVLLADIYAMLSHSQLSCAGV